MNVDATMAKIYEVMKEASGNGASALLFPESFLPAYPYWVWILPATEQAPLFAELYRRSITVPGPETAKIGEWSRQLGLCVVVGVNERDSHCFGTLYNTNVIVGSDGRLLGRHRKIVPTFAEKLVWGNGDGSGYRVYDTSAGRIGTLPCGENTNPLARFALLAQGEQIHFANFPAFPIRDWYDEAEAIRIRVQNHAFEGKIFVGCATGLFDKAVIDYLGGSTEIKELFSGRNYALTGVFGPDGRAVSEILIDQEGVCYADCDLQSEITAKMMHDITGGYNNFGVLSLSLDRSVHRPISIHGGDQPVPPVPEAPSSLSNEEGPVL